jgi:gliding motility-associated-like protein
MKNNSKTIFQKQFTPVVLFLLIVSSSVAQTKPHAIASYVSSLTCRGINYLFVDESTNATVWSWSFGDGTTSSLQNPPMHNYEYNGKYTVTLVVSNNIDYDTLLIPINIGDINTLITIQPTNVFTPNEDTKNDLFVPVIVTNNSTESVILSQCMSMEIFDRWGGKVFETKGGSKTYWDGKTITNTKADEGTYYYLITLGSNIFRGSVTLLRNKT